MWWYMYDKHEKFHIIEWKEKLQIYNYYEKLKESFSDIRISTYKQTSIENNQEFFVSVICW